MKVVKLLFCCSFLALPIWVQAQSGSKANASESAKKFVQGFYDWYVPKALSTTSEPASNIAIRVKGNYFSQELEHELREDAEAQAKAEGEIVGLDFDPFLAGQDPSRHYNVGKVIPKGDSYLVEVHRVISGKPEVKLTVTAEVASKSGRWYFVNFLYPTGDNLLSVLQALKDDRDKVINEKP